MSLFTSITKLFRNLDLRKSSDHDDEAHVNRAPRTRSTLSPSFSRLARMASSRHSEASRINTKRSKDSITKKASAADDHGEIGSQDSQKPTDSVTGHSGPSPSSQQHPRTPSTISTVSAVSQESIQTILAPTSTTHSLENATPSTSASTSPSSLDTVRADPSSNRRPSEESSTSSLDSHDAEMAEKRALFINPDPSTRNQRRQALYEMPNELYMTAAGWFHEHPEDLWATDEEQEANFTRMALDRRIEIAAQDDVDGLQNNDGEEFLRSRPDYRRMRRRARKVGWFRAWQESVFGKKWCCEGGMFGKKGRGGPLLEEVGPMGETL